MDDIESFLSRFEAMARLEIKYRDWHGTPAEHWAELEAARKSLPLPCGQMSGLYLGGEDFDAVWVVGEAEPGSFLRAAADYIAHEAGQAAEELQVEILTWFGMLHVLGEGAIDHMVGLLRASAPGIRREYRRATTERDGVEMFAPIDTVDPDFDEARYQICAREDEHAKLITRMDVAPDALEEMIAFLDARGACAAAVLRGETLPA